MYVLGLVCFLSYVGLLKLHEPRTMSDQVLDQCALCWKYCAPQAGDLVAQSAVA